MLRKFVSIWKSENSLDEVFDSQVEMVVPLTYAMSSRSHLAVATKMNFEKAMEMLAVFPNAVLAFGNWPFAFKGAWQAESKLKHEMLPTNFLRKVLEVTLGNSVGEAENVREATKELKAEPKCILLITGELHSRSARFIWQKVFPSAKILVLCIDCQYEVERESIIPDQRSLVKWAVIALVRQFLLRVFGLSVRNLRHRVVELNQEPFS